METQKIKSMKGINTHELINQIPYTKIEIEESNKDGDDIYYRNDNQEIILKDNILLFELTIDNRYKNDVDVWAVQLLTLSYDEIEITDAQALELREGIIKTINY